MALFESYERRIDKIDTDTRTLNQKISERFSVVI